MVGRPIAPRSCSSSETVTRVLTPRWDSVVSDRDTHVASAQRPDWIRVCVARHKQKMVSWGQMVGLETERGKLSALGRKCCHNDGGTVY